MATSDPSPAESAPLPPPSLRHYGGETWAGTRALIRSDYDAMLRHFLVEDRPSLARRLYWFLLPNFFGLTLYRLCHLAYAKGWRNLARSLYMFKVYTTRMEISPQTVIGPGAIISHANGVTLDGHIGARCHIYGQCNTGRGFSMQDVGAGAGLPVIGDDVVLAYGCMVIGGIQVGDRARIGPGAIVSRDVPADAMVLGPASRTVRDCVGSGSAVHKLQDAA